MFVTKKKLKKNEIKSILNYGYGPVNECLSTQLKIFFYANPFNKFLKSTLKEKNVKDFQENKPSKKKTYQVKKVLITQLLWEAQV